jgi:hypothetical protein
MNVADVGDNAADREDTVAGDEVVAGDYAVAGNEVVAGDDAFAGDDAVAGYDDVAGDQVLVGRDSSRLVPYSNSGVDQERGKGSCLWSH